MAPRRRLWPFVLLDVGPGFSKRSRRLEAGLSWRGVKGIRSRLSRRWNDSGAFNDGTLRSVRSGVGMEELGVLGEMEHITDMWALQVSSPSDFSDTLVVTFVNETRVFRFSPDGEVEELDDFLGLNLAENTLLSSNLPGGRVIHVTESGVSIADTDSGMVTSKWSSDGQMITSAACNDERLVVVTGGQVLATHYKASKTYIANHWASLVKLSREPFF